MKNKKGVSMIELTIVIIIAILIIGFTVLNGLQTTDEAKITELYAEMKAVKNSLSPIQFELEYNDSFEFMQGIHYDRVLTIEEKTGIDDADNYYLIYGSLDKKDATARKVLGIEDMKRTYLVNFETRDVILKDPIKIGQNTIKTFDDVAELAK